MDQDQIKQEESKERPTAFVIGHRAGRVVLQSMGTDAGVPPHWMSWTPDQARQVAAMLLASADAADAGQEP